MRFGLDEATTEKLTKVFESNPKVDKAFIFGSRAKGNYREDSDIDVALKGYNLQWEDVLTLSAALEEAGAPYKVDLLAYGSIKEPALVEHIDRVGIEFYSRWEQLTLGDLIEQKKANLQTGPFGTMLNASEYSKGGVPVIAVQDIGDNQLLHNKLVFVEQETADRLSRYRVKRHDIIFGRKGATDRRALIKENEEGWLQGSDCIRLRLDDSISSEFVSYQLGTLKEWMAQFSTGATMPSLNQEILKLLPLNLPPLLEQQNIAQVLNGFDQKIDLLRRQNKTLERLAEVLFRQWFAVQAQETWNQKSLTQIADYLNGLALQKFRAQTDDSLPVIKIREMKEGVTENTDRCSRNIPPQYIVHDGDVLFSWSGSLDVMLWTGEDGALNQHLFKVTSNDYPKWFYYLATRHHLEVFRAIAESKSTTMGHIQRSHLQNAMIALPPDDLFETYNQQMTPMFEKMIDNNRQICSLTKLRDTLLPKLMSGEARVSIPTEQ